MDVTDATNERKSEMSHLCDCNKDNESGISCVTCRWLIITDLQDQFASAIEAETEEGLEQAANSITWSELWQISFNDLLELIQGEQK